MSDDVNNISVSAFVETDADLRLHPPREYETSAGKTGITSWILQVGRTSNEITLHFRDKADLYRLVDEINAKAGPR